jgi:hypothetical protein
LQKAFFVEHTAAADISPAANGAVGIEPAAADPHSQLPPISLPERLGVVLLLGTSLLIGLYPRLLLDLIVPSLTSPLFDGLKRTCSRWTPQ